MRLTLTLAAVAAAVLTASAAHAQDPVQDPATAGDYRADLNKMIAQVADGTCPADLMAADLLAECETSIWQIGPALAQLGPISTMTLVRIDGEGAERVEVYAATYEGGQALNWGIGGLADGKYTVAYAGGQ